MHHTIHYMQRKINLRFKLILVLVYLILLRLIHLTSEKIKEEFLRNSSTHKIFKINE